MKRLFVVILILSLSSVSLGQELAINEFLAVNDTTIADQDGEYDDWVELFNNSNNAISLNGYYLSDDGADLTRWVFPDTAIGAGDFLIIWTDNDEDQNGLHTSFRLSSSGEAVYLVDQDTAIVDSVTFGVQAADISTGRFPDGTGEFKPMYPTFSAPNNGEDPGYTDPTEIIFDDTKIHNYELHFYIDNWRDSLKYYFEELDKEYMPAQLIYENTVVLDSIGVRYKGNSSYVLSSNTPKKPFKFRFDKYKDDRTLYGIGRLNLSNCISDPSFMRESISYDIARCYMPAPRTAYANLYIEGELIGFYVQVEQIDKLFLDRQFEDNSFNLYKASDNGATLKYRGEDPIEYASEYELKTNDDLNDWSGLITMIDKLNNTPDDDFIDTMSNYLNLDNCIRHLAFNMVLSHFDSYTGSGRNFYLYDDRTTGQFNILTWDLNESFGAYTNNWDVITQDVIDISNISQRPLLERIMENDSLRQVYLDYILDMINGPASYDSVAAMADRIKPLIEDYVEADDNKLYSYQKFIDNIENNVYVSLGRIIPGIKSFSQSRNANLLLQLTGDKVYPGDTDNNGVVDALDVLPVGVYFLQQGCQRDSVTFAWEAWLTLTWDIPAATFADANGDGIVDEKDVIGIGVNWGNTHEGESLSFEIDTLDQILLNGYRDNFVIIYNSLSGRSEPVTAIRTLLESVLDIDTTIPTAYSLDHNYPNPFNPVTVIGFTLLDRQYVTLTIYNMLGQVIYTPIRKQIYEAGRYEYILDASKFSNGTYIYRIETDNWRGVRKMTVIR